MSRASERSRGEAEMSEMARDGRMAEGAVVGEWEVCVAWRAMECCESV